MSDKEIILTTLEFLKNQGDKSTDGVDIREVLQDFKDLDQNDHERIRDRLVINRYASFPIPGDQWKLIISWHPNGGVDILTKPRWIVNKNGPLETFIRAGNL